MKRGFGFIQERMVYDDYLRRLNVRAVLDHYGVENDREEPGKEGTTEIVHSCLVDRVERHHNNGDANPSASVNVDRKKYVCWAFWGGDMFDFIAKMEDEEDFNGILPIVRDFLEGSTVDQDAFLAELDRLFTTAPRGQGNADLPFYASTILKPWQFVHPYLAERGIDPDTAKRLRLGWREDLNRITIPVFWGGELVGWQARAVPDRPGLWPGTWDGGFPKYKSSPGFPKSSVFYVPDGEGRLDRVGREVVVVESPFSVIKATALGVSRPVVATFGAKVSQHQINMLAGFDHVTVWADDDDAGRFMERKMVRGLANRTAVSVVTPDHKMDMGDYDAADLIEEKIEQATPAMLKMIEWKM
ncbi:DNA primase [Mycobacterium phage Cali]|uniref:DNA primase n=16 Tax=Bixzunavirus TaxID=680114 RepID=B5LKS6_9CAUD|nr:DNA primase [Mycobacterium phage ScottMcG]YP_002224420.1 gp199 [Mycobacterium phage Spud]YP_002224642.1 gp198 [Mycobacterium phage Cali]YP_009012958.1 DNA primase [Mycobacterium phage Dandelion]YP_009014764.1 primase [Mycobacterium phage LinStu]YP_009017949.1 DNA primase [Mycobacterium phage Pleione]YP_009204731.1 DNA primase [Mycobacterium phage HyRo]YP_009216429.1 DNA primase [Mycobacterium phage Alice]YP_009597766.1 DNA primase [Mycobacterium phage Lukilu]YP_009608857.1 primase [Myco